MKTKSLYLKIFLAIFLSIFLLFYLNIHDYGLPYFINADETAGIKSLLYFYGFFTYANQNVVEPIYFPLINFLSTGFLIFVKNIFTWNYTISELKDFFYLNPHLLYKFGRISSLIFCFLSLIFYYLITKKLKLNNLYILISFFGLITSYLFFDVAIVHGKNSLLLLLFLIQYYFFIKYFFKLEKFGIKSYIILALLASLAWGINYWAATPSLYAIALLHFEKFRFKNKENIYLFLILFLVFGALINYVISGDKIFHHLYTDDFLITYDGLNRVEIFFHDLLNGLKIILNIEKPILYLSILLFITKFKYCDGKSKKFLILTVFLILEPILLFALADGSYPQLRYFGPSIFLIYILIGFLINLQFVKILRFNNFFLFLSCLLFVFFSYEKILILKKSKKIIENNFTLYEVLNEFNYSNDTLFFTINMTYRENIKTLNLYKSLLNRNLIKLNPNADNKNSLKEIDKKINIIKRSEKKNIFPSSKQHVFFGGEYLIDNHKDFFNYIKESYKYVAIISNKSDEFNFLLNNFEVSFKVDSQNVSTVRSISNILEKNFSLSSISHIENVGNSISVFKLN